MQNAFDVTFPPNTAVNANLLSTGGGVDITIPEGAVQGHVNNLLLMFDITNSTGAACTLSPAPMLFRDIQVIANRGQQIQLIPGEHLFTDLSYLSTENLTAMAADLNTTATLGAGTAITNNGVITYTVPFQSCCIFQAHINLGGVQGSLIFRLTFKASSDTVESGAAPTISNIRLYVLGDAMSKGVQAKKVNKYMSNTFDFQLHKD